MTNYTAKTKAAKIQAFAITGRRWVQRATGNTYNTATVAALIDGTWQDLGKTCKAYGYGDGYIVEGIEWLQRHGFLSQNANGTYNSRQANRIETHVHDVKRERDL